MQSHENPTRETRRPRGQANVRSLASTSGRIPPQALEIEKAVLGAMLIERSARARVFADLGSLEDGVFYLPRHEKIFQAIRHLEVEESAVDLLTVSHELNKRGELEGVGGEAYLADLTMSVASAENVGVHARIVLEKALLRQLIETMTRSIAKAYDKATDTFDLLDKVESDIFRINEASLRKTAKPIDSLVQETLERLEAIHGKKEGITGVPSGFADLDRLTGGWQASDLIIIAARPSMGKTALALACALNAALHKKKATPVAVFSLEMTAEQLTQRLLMSEARVDAQRARTGQMNKGDWAKLASQRDRLAAAPILLDDSPALGIMELRSKARRLKAEQGIGLLVVDYLQLMHGPETRNANREQEIAKISRSLKALAKELNIPVIALSQLNRGVENRTGSKRPQLSDLRESGSIEQDADVVLFIYRAERYGIMTDENQNSTEGLAEIIVSKQRNGPTGKANLSFARNYARFDNLSVRPPFEDDEASEWEDATESEEELF